MLSALSRKRIPLNQNECTADFRIGVPFEQNLQSIHERLEINKKIIQEKQGKDKPERGADRGVR